MFLAIPSPVLCVAALIAGGVAAALAWAGFVGRSRARRRRRYRRLRVVPYRGDSAEAEAVVAMFESLHKRLASRWWRRLWEGQPSVALEVHFDGEGWLALCCQEQAISMVESALRVAYPNCRLAPATVAIARPPAVLRLKKRELFIKRSKVIDRFAHAREPAVNRLLSAIAAAGCDGFVQVAMTPAPAAFERHAKRLYKRHEAELSRQRGQGIVEPRKDRSLVEQAELVGGLDVQHRPLFFADLRVIAPDRRACERIASQLRAEAAENELVERGTTVRHGLLGLYARRVVRGEGNPLPSSRRGVFASTELAAIWHMPSVDYAAVPFARAQLPLAPASPAIMRAREGQGALRDCHGPVSIHPAMRRQNTAVTGTVEQGKSSYLAATVAEDLRRSRCAVVVFDPKGDAADVAASLAPEDRTVTMLDFSHPTCGFNPLAVEAPADVIADYVVAALKNLFTDADIRASSDRYLRNAIIAVLAYSRSCTLWDAARLLSVGRDGYAYRAKVGARVRELPELREISEFFTAELAAQLADARSTTTSKLDAPVNKLARLLNSASIKRVLLNDSLTVDFDRVMAGGEVLVVKGALGAMGAGNTSVLMQLLIGMLDAALARQQDLVDRESRVAVALKVDEAPLVLNRGFAETIALKRSAGLETVACWQTDAQWTDREVRAQLDALFAHRVCFATASAEDARASAKLMMAEFSDTVRPRVEHLSALGRPDARLHLPRHHAIASWTTADGRQPPFLAQTIPLEVDHDRLRLHLRRQEERGGRYMSDLSQPHWERVDHERVDRERPAKAAPSAAATGVGKTPDASQPPRPSGAAQATGAARGFWAGRPPEARSKTQPSGTPRRAQSPAAVPRLPVLPETVAPSYGELVELDRAHKVRRATSTAARPAGQPDGRDLEVLATVASFRHVLTTQLHRSLGSARSLTTTQRLVKRLADAGLLERLQFHRPDGGGVPMCCAVTPLGVRKLEARAAGSAAAGDVEPEGAPDQSAASAAAVRRDVHAAGWALAFKRAASGSRIGIVGPALAAISPPMRSTPAGQRPMGPDDLKLPGGRAPHRFLRLNHGGALEQVERFETIRPQLRIEAAQEHRPLDGGASPGERLELCGPSPAWPFCDLLVEMDDRFQSYAWAAKLHRYDHFLAGWSAHLRRYGRELGEPPLVVFVCRDRSRARECARRADALLVACRAYAGERPTEWEYTGRERIVFVAERDVHEGLLGGYTACRLPPKVRAESGGDGRQVSVEARAPGIRVRALMGAGGEAETQELAGGEAAAGERVGRGPERGGRR